MWGVSKETVRRMFSEQPGVLRITHTTTNQKRNARKYVTLRRHLCKVRADLEMWMDENDWSSLDEMLGNMGFERVPDPPAYERKQT